MRWRVRYLWRRLIGMFGRTRRMRELDEEIRTHIEMETERLVSEGLPLKEARRRARLNVGGTEQTREAYRRQAGAPFLEDLLRDLRYGARVLGRTPAFTVLILLTLALGIGVGSTVFSVIEGVVLRPLPFDAPDRLVSVITSIPDHPERRMSLSPPLYAAYREMDGIFEAFAVHAGTAVNLTGGTPERVLSAGVSPGFFETLRVRPLVGRTIVAADIEPGAEPVAVISWDLWQRRFGGDAAALKSELVVDEVPRRIIGILPRGKSWPADREVWVPLVFGPGEMDQAYSMYLDGIGRLTEGEDLQNASHRLDDAADRFWQARAEEGPAFGARLEPLKERVVGSVRAVLGVVMGTALFVLLIACANVANLTLARATGRRREMAVRRALGAGRGRLVRQLLTEHILIALLGGALGLVSAIFASGLVRRYGPSDLPRIGDIRVDGTVILVTFGITMVAGLLFGLAPLAEASESGSGRALKEGTGGTAGRGILRLRGVLLVSEITLSLMLITGAGLLMQTLWDLSRVDPGFDPAGVMTARVQLPRRTYDGAGQARFVRDLLDRLEGRPGVTAAAVTNVLPLSGSNTTYGFLTEEAPDLDEGEVVPTANLRSVTADYFAVMRIPLLRGRFFSAGDVQGSQEVAIVNQALIERYWPGQGAIGRRIWITRGSDPAWRTIVGVVPGVRHDGLDQPAEPEVYVPFSQQPFTWVCIAARTPGPPAALAGAIREAVAAVDPHQPVTRLLTLPEVVGASFAGTRFYGGLLAAFALLALVLTCIGVYGVMSFLVSQRAREIGIRMALGADRGRLLKSMMGQGLRLAVTGIVLGILGALALSGMLRTLLFEVAPGDPSTLSASAAIILIVAAGASVLPIRRALRADPTEALRWE